MERSPPLEAIKTEVEPGVYITTCLVPAIPPSYEESQDNHCLKDGAEQEERLIPTAPPCDDSEQPPPYRPSDFEQSMIPVYQSTTIKEKSVKSDFWRWERRKDKVVPRMGMGWKLVIGTGFTIFSPIIIPLAILFAVVSGCGNLVHSYLFE